MRRKRIRNAYWRTLGRLFTSAICNIEQFSFYRAMRCISAVFAVMQCLSVSPSVRHVRGSRQNE